MDDESDSNAVEDLNESDDENSRENMLSVLNRDHDISNFLVPSSCKKNHLEAAKISDRKR